MTTTRAQRIGVVVPPTAGAWDGKSTAAPIVWKEDGRYHMLYQGWSDGSGPRILGLAYSEDGLHWAKYGRNPVMMPSAGTWDQGGFECGLLLKIDGSYWLYYTGIGVDGKDTPRICQIQDEVHAIKGSGCFGLDGSQGGQRKSSLTHIIIS